MGFIIAFLVEALLLLILYKRCSEMYSGFEELDEKDFRLKKLLPIGVFILQDVIKYKFDKPRDAVKQGKLAQLYGPKQAAAYLRINAAHQICIILVGILMITFLAGVSMISAGWNQDPQNAAVSMKGNEIQRPAYGEGSKNVKLTASYKDGELEESVDYFITIGEKLPDDEGCVALVEEKLEATILSGNKDLANVKRDLNLISKSSALKVDIDWETSDKSVIDEDGTVFRPKNGNGDKPVTLTALISKGRIEKEKVYQITVLEAAPLTDEESIEEAKESVSEQLKIINNNQTSETVALPGTIDSTKINWKQVVEKSSSTVEILVFGVLILAVLILLNNKTLNDRIKVRRQMIQIDYPEFLNKLIILLTSGMAMPKALEKIASDYVAISERKGIKKPLYEELVLTVGEVNGGKIFSEAINDFAQRCKTREILKFVALVELNQKKGSGELVSTLKLQANEAWETRKNVAKRRGEEASTKLLFPMMIMLIAILIIVITPAIMSIAGM